MGRFAKITLNTVLILILNVFCVMFMAFDSEVKGIEVNEKKFIYTHDDRLDPFLPLLSSKGLAQKAGPSSGAEMMSHVSKIKVSGILWDEVMPVVMINNKMRKEGDVVENLTIKKINVNGVILGYHDLTYEILLIKKKEMYDQGGVQ